ncbi:MAG: alpha/beta hydrolase [Treponema sp.]|nr:alpha/beta hydrolase [Candidatus Treponema equifaecale]
MNFSFSKDYSKKIYLWDGVPEMETQMRDTVLYVCDKIPAEKIDSEKKLPAVIVCPGGSYHHLGMPHEGFASARWFNSIGVKAFVLRYRVAYNCHHYPDQLEDLQLAMAYIRANAKEFGIDENKIGAIGYSAGGHIVAMAGEFASTHNELLKLKLPEEIKKQSVRPDFVMPIYPVVTMQDDISHKWSRRSLLGHQWSEPNANKGWRPWNFWGHDYSQKMKDEFSMEMNVPDDMPPTFILACHDDPVVIYENSVRLEKALAQKNIPHKFVNYPEGGHGFGMKENSKIMKATHWNDKDLLPWLKEIGVL